MNKIEQEDKEALSGELQIIQPRQRLFRTRKEAWDFVRNITANKVLLETTTNVSRNVVWVVTYYNDEGAGDNI